MKIINRKICPNKVGQIGKIVNDINGIVERYMGKPSKKNTSFSLFRAFFVDESNKIVLLLRTEELSCSWFLKAVQYWRDTLETETQTVVDYEKNAAGTYTKKKIQISKKALLSKATKLKIVIREEGDAIDGNVCVKTKFVG